MLWTLGEIWCVVSLSGLAFSALREMLPLRSYLRWISILNNSQRNIDFHSLSTWASASLMFHRYNNLISDLRYTFHEIPNDPPAFPFRKDSVLSVEGPYLSRRALVCCTAPASVNPVNSFPSQDSATLLLYISSLPLKNRNQCHNHYISSNRDQPQIC